MAAGAYNHLAPNRVINCDMRMALRAFLLNGMRKLFKIGGGGHIIFLPPVNVLFRPERSQAPVDKYHALCHRSLSDS